MIAVVVVVHRFSDGSLKGSLVGDDVIGREGPDHGLGVTGLDDRRSPGNRGHRIPRARLGQDIASAQGWQLRPDGLFMGRSGNHQDPLIG